MRKIHIKIITIYKSILKPVLLKLNPTRLTTIYYLAPICVLIIAIIFSNSFYKSYFSAIFSGIISLLILYLVNIIISLINFLVADGRKIRDASAQYGGAYTKRITIGSMMPLTFLYEPIILKGKRNLSIIVSDDPLSFYRPPFLIRNNYIEILDAFSNEYIENFLCYRLEDIECKGETITLYTSRMYCFDNLVTNFAMDYKIGKNVTVRMLYEFGTRLTPLYQSDLGNQIGINALVALNDDVVLLPRRSWNSTVSKNKITASIAMALEDYDKCQRKLSSQDLLRNCIVNGLVHRVGIPFHDAKRIISNIVFLGMGRIINWGGKPQMYYYVELNINSLQLLSLSNMTDKSGNIIDENREILFCKNIKSISDSTCEIEYLNTRPLLLKHREKKITSHFKIEESLMACFYHIAYSSFHHNNADWLFRRLSIDKKK